MWLMCGLYVADGKHRRRGRSSEEVLSGGCAARKRLPLAVWPDTHWWYTEHRLSIAALFTSIVQAIHGDERLSETANISH